MYALKYIFINVIFNSICWKAFVESIFVESRNSNIITEDSEIVKRWTEYCKELYNYPINPDENILNDDRVAYIEENLPILKSEVEHVIRSLKRENQQVG